MNDRPEVARCPPRFAGKHSITHKGGGEWAPHSNRKVNSLYTFITFEILFFVLLELGSPGKFQILAPIVVGPKFDSQVPLPAGSPVRVFRYLSNFSLHYSRHVARGRTRRRDRESLAFH